MSNAASRLPANTAHHRAVGRYEPRSMSVHSRRRFFKDRRARYRSMLSGPPTERQLSLMDGMVRAEWAALKAEAEGTLRGDREAREQRRLLERLFASFERSLRSANSGRPDFAVADLIAAALGGAEQ